MTLAFKVCMLADSTLVKITATNETPSNDGSSKVFYIHKGLLQNASPYFRAVKNFREGHEDVIEFKGVDPKAVGTYVYWLYNHGLPEEAQYSDMPTLISAYSFGDYILATDFKDFITNHVRTHACAGEAWLGAQGLKCSPKCLTMMQQAGLRQTDGLARYILDHLAHGIATRGNSAFSNNYPDVEDQEFFRSGGDWVRSLTEKVISVAVAFVNDRLDNGWHDYAWEVMPRHPSLDQTGKYLDSPAAPAAEDQNGDRTEEW